MEIIQEVVWNIFVLLCRGIIVIMLIAVVAFFCKFIWIMATNGGRKWYYYNPGKPWQGGYWSPQLPRHPPYNQYKWNPETCRFEHKETGAPLHPWQKPLRVQTARKKRPGWLRFLLEETPATLWAKHKQKRWRKNNTRD